jgi:hypothetical protein
MTAKGLLTRLAFLLVLAAGMAPWALGQARSVDRDRHVGSRPPEHRTFIPYIPYGFNTYYYPGPIAPYAPGFFPLDGLYNWYYPPLFSPPRYSPLLPGSTPVPLQAPDWYYNPYVYPPPYYGGYYPTSPYQWYYGYAQPWNRPGWQRDFRLRPGRPNPQAPTEVPRND